jgi:hypothetical protein
MRRQGVILDPNKGRKMRFIIDAIVAISFWSLSLYSGYEVYDFFGDGAIKNISRGLTSTEKFSEALIQK